MSPASEEVAKVPAPGLGASFLPEASRGARRAQSAGWGGSARYSHVPPGKLVPFTQSPNQYLVSISYVTSTLLGSGSSTMNKTERNLCSRGVVTSINGVGKTGYPPAKA